MNDVAPKSSRILHISDLHFGCGFQELKWVKLVEKATALKPDLVMVTGDLVNTPWRWMLRRAAQRLRELDGCLAQGDEPRGEIWIIPGNHDTRITGLVPVGSLLYVAIACLVMGVVLWLLGEIQPPLPDWAHKATRWSAYGLGGVAASVTLLRALVGSDLKKYFGEYLLSEATVSSRIPVGIVPFDSATDGVPWARGRVSRRSFSRFPDELPVSQDGKNISWIAAVHHHPLPLPYDSQAEATMAMDNAGAFLSQLSKRGIPLVLHGHKHHQHFARINIDSGNSRRSEIAVLSAGTPTKSKNPGKFRHGFNVVHVDAMERIHIDMYEAEESGTFEISRSFALAPLEEQDRRRFENDCQVLGTQCKRMLCLVDIGPYGDASFEREFRSVTTSRHSVKELPGPYTAFASRGTVEAFIARSLCEHGPSVSLTPIAPPQARGRIDAKIEFDGNGLQAGIQPIHFVTRFFANNAFALNLWQFKCMYPGRSHPRESISFEVPDDIAIQELLMQVHFPSDEDPQRSLLPRRISIGQECGTGERRWDALPNDYLVRMESQGVVQVRIPFPIRKSIIEINWELRENVVPPPESDMGREVARALSLRKQFNALLGKPPPGALESLLESIEILARNLLSDGKAADTSYDRALFVFNEDDMCLRYLMGTHASDDPRRQGCYPFGLGIVGRAFKSANYVAFRRPTEGPQTQPWCYVMPDGSAVLDEDAVKEWVILGIPLVPPAARSWPYAVLQLSTDSTLCELKTENTASDNALETFRDMVIDLTRDFEDILREANGS